MKLFECKVGWKRVYLTVERWKHILAEHPTLVNGMLRLEETLQHPMEVHVDEEDERLAVYYRHYKDAPTPTRYLVVIVKYLNGEGFIVTSFYAKGREP